LITELLDPNTGATLEYGPNLAVFKQAMSTATVGAKTHTLDLARIGMLIGAPASGVRMFVEGASSAPSSAVTTLRVSPNDGTFFDTDIAVTGVTSDIPDLLDVRGVPFLDAAITTAEASDSIVVYITIYGER